MLITLYSKAKACPHSLIVDEKGQEILAGIDYDFSQLKVPPGTWLTVCIRAKQLDEYASEFLTEHPDSVIVHLGCGLDSRCLRVDNGQVEWYDLDLPDVIELRQKFFEETGRYHMLAASVTDMDWISAVETKGRPVMVIAEGLMMYLQEAEVKALVLAMQTQLGAQRLAFDAYSEMTAKRAHSHPSLKKTGAVIQWGIDDAREIENWGEGIRLQEEWAFVQSQGIASLPLRHRLIFGLTGLFPIIRRAHRILYYTL
jgi:O-methyltransferase involved in polyketide biosynthesis